MTTDLLTRLDVRPILADGGEPFDLILETAARIPPGGELELVAPFDPVPLVPHLRLRGFRRGVVAEGHDGVVTRWRRTGVTAETSVAEAAASGPAAAAVLGRHGFDLCCGGPKTLTFAAQAHGVDLQTLLAELHEAAG